MLVAHISSFDRYPRRFQKPRLGTVALHSATMRIGGQNWDRTSDAWLFGPTLYLAELSSHIECPSRFELPTPPWQGGMLPLHHGHILAGDDRIELSHFGSEPNTLPLGQSPLCCRVERDRTNINLLRFQTFIQ